MTEASKPARPAAREFQADLLRAARAEQPRKRSIERTLAAAALLAVETCEGTAAKPPSFHGDLLRRLAFPVAGVVVAGAIAFGVLRAEAPAPAPTPPSPAPLVTVAVPLAVLPPADVPAPALAISSLREAQPPTAQPRSPSPPQKPRPVEPSSSAAGDPGENEITMLRRAKSQLSASDPRGALATLDAHDRVFPDGALMEEAEALRIGALAQAGDVTRARLAGARFLAAHPESPYAQRVRTVMGAPPLE